MSSISPTDPGAPTSRWPVFMSRSAFIVAALITIIVAFYVVEKMRGNAAWKAYQAEARARGVKLTMAELVPPPVPDERNFAAVPIFQQMFAQPTPPAPFAFPQVSGTKPPFDAAYKSARIDLAAWQQFFVTAKMIPAASESAPRDVLQALEKFAPEFAQLRLAGERPDSRFPVRYEDGAAAGLPHLQIFTNAARLYALRLSAHLALGDSPAAYEDFRDGFRLYTALEMEPTLIAGLVRLSVLSVLENAVWGGLAGHQWGAPELEKIGAHLAKVRLMDDYARGLNSERGFSNMIHDQMLQKPSKEVASLFQMTSAGGPAPNAWGAQTAVSLYPTGWVRLSQTRANRYFDEMLARVAQEPPRVFTERAVPSLPQPMSGVSVLERVRYLLFFTLAPALNELERTYAHGQTLLDQTLLGCALERHRLAHGSFPASLEALVPALLPALPRDVMTGDPLHYRVNADGGYTLYSVAWNLADDGGKSDAKLNTKQQPDWVWTVPGK